MAITNTTIANLVGADEKALGATINYLAPLSNELVQSGLTASSPVVDRVANGPRKGSLPFLKPLTTDEVNVTTDNINDEGSVGSMEGDEFTTVRLDANYGWGFTDLTRAVTQYNDKGGAAGMVVEWQNGVDKKLLASGILGARKAVEDNADITFDLTGEFDMSAIHAAAATAEEWMDLYKIMLVSHGRYAKMQSAQAGFTAPAQTNTRFADYQGYTLLRTNTLTDDQVVIARTGAVAYGTGLAAGMVGVEYERRANAANGGGADILHNRFSRIIHPQGLDYLGAVPKKGDNIFELLSLDGAWALKVPAAQFGFRFINFKVA